MDGGVDDSGAEDLIDKTQYCKLYFTQKRALPPYV